MSSTPFIDLLASFCRMQLLLEAPITSETSKAQLQPRIFHINLPFLDTFSVFVDRHFRHAIVGYNCSKLKKLLTVDRCQHSLWLTFLLRAAAKLKICCPRVCFQTHNKKDGYRQQNVRQWQKLISIIDYDVCMTFY